MIDTHCHLTFPDFAGRTRAVLSEAAEAGVTGLITVSTTLGDAEDAARVAEAHERVWHTVGVHPLYADRGPHDWPMLNALGRRPKCVAWGELGLDNHYDRPEAGEQRRVLAEQLAAIQAVHEGWGRDGVRDPLPIVLHCRKAFADLIPILRDTALPPERFVFHCFTGGPVDMEMLLDFGAMVSFTGVLTYRNAPEVREAAKLAPLDRIMVETDAPFLPPEPYRGKRPCQPAWVRHTAEALAAIHNMPLEGEGGLHQHLNTNTERFFGVK